MFEKEITVNKSSGLIVLNARRILSLSLIQRFLAVFFSAVILFLAAGETARAGVFTVTKAEMTNDNVCDADCSFLEAVARANFEPFDEVINFSPAVFNTPRIRNLPNVLRLVGSGTSLTINGPGAHLLSIKAPLGDAVFSIDNNVSFMLNNLTLIGGEINQAAALLPKPEPACYS